MWISGGEVKIGVGSGKINFGCGEVECIGVVYRCSEGIARIVTESLDGLKAVFSCRKRATNGSSFCGFEKTAFEQRACSGKLDWLLKIFLKNALRACVF